ncbi:MAG: TRAP transporter permease, partial [Gammaproteobacteria bacterium]|nr:TRAP transporter permease [Gammaproteobacteria bacterium]
MAVGVAMSLFHLYSGAFGTLPAIQQRSLHLLFVFILTFLIYPAKKGVERKWPPFYDWALILLSLASIGYIFVNYEWVAFERYWFVTPLLPIEKVLGLVIIGLVLESARRTVGLFLTLVAAAFLLYWFVGQYLPGMLYHRPLTISMLLDMEYLSTAGIFGVPLGISATYVVLFIIFGAFMLQTGFGEFLTDVATGVTGRTRGGPAKVAVFSSALFGTISGSGSANVAITGTFTIPMMKRVGFKPHFAAAVEAAASTGGQIMPPIMGAAAFLMAEYSGIPYIQIIKHAAIPAILYFTGAFFMVDLEAAKSGIRGLAREELPTWKGKILVYGHLVIPIAFLLYLLISGRTIFYSVTWSILAIFVLSFLRKATRLNLNTLINALWAGARGTIIVAVACAIAGLIIGTIQITGIGDRIISLIVDISGGYMIAGLVVAMFAAIVLGMGMPTSAAYVLMVVLVIPGLMKIGVPLLQAHMFAFYFAMLSLVTPPVATASYVAAGIAGSSMTKTGWTSVKVAAAAYIVPFMFVFAPALLLVGSPGEIVLAIPTALLGIYALALSIQGWGLKSRLNTVQRIMALAAAILMLFPGWQTDVPGGILLASLYLWER